MYPCTRPSCLHLCAVIVLANAADLCCGVPLGQVRVHWVGTYASCVNMLLQSIHSSYCDPLPLQPLHFISAMQPPVEVSHS